MSEATQRPSNLPADWTTWPVLPNRKVNSHPKYEGGVEREKFLIDGASEHHEEICAAIAAALLPLTADPKVRLGRFTRAEGPTTSPMIRLEYLEDEWTVFTAELWTSTNLDSSMIVIDHFSSESGSWFGRHLIRHPMSPVWFVVAMVAHRFIRLLWGGLLFCFFAALVGGVMQIAPKFVSEAVSESAGQYLEVVFGRVLAVLLVGVVCSPYCPRLYTSDSSVVAHQHLVDRIRQCINSALASLGIPASAVHYSDKTTPVP